MSLAGRSRIVINGVRRMRTYHYFRCQACQRTVRIYYTNPNIASCPYCFNALNYELHISRPSLLMNVPNNLEPSPATQFLDSLALVLDPSMRSQNTISNTENERERENNDPMIQQSWITIRFVRPTHAPRLDPPLQNDNGETISENTLDDFVDGRLASSQPGPPPAAASAVEALPVVKVTQAHLASDPYCPICKDEFRIDVEVRELPCKHFYHSDCILPWLSIHNTCPVCRYELPQAFFNHHFQGENNENSMLNRFWSQISSLWPLRAILDWSTQGNYLDFRETHDGGEMWDACRWFVVALVFHFIAYLYA